MESVKTNCRLSPFLLRSSFSLAVAVFILFGAKAVLAENDPQIAISNADYVATDALGRRMPTYQEVGGPKPDRYVGMFYWQWHGPDRWGLDYNATEVLMTHLGFRDFEAHPKGGPDDPT